MFSYKVFLLLTPQHQATAQRKQIGKLIEQRFAEHFLELSYSFSSKSKGRILDEMRVSFKDNFLYGILLGDFFCHKTVIIIYAKNFAKKLSGSVV